MSTTSQLLEQCVVQAKASFAPFTSEYKELFKAASIGSDHKTKIEALHNTAIGMSILASRRNDANACMDRIKGLVAPALILKWAETKQVLRFNAEFLEALRSTSSVTYVKGCFDYLPYSTFYIDVSDSAEISNEFEMDGVFVHVSSRIIDDQKVYCFDMDLLKGEVHRVIQCKIPDEDMDIDNMPKEGSAPIDVDALHLMLRQIFVYLSSVDADIQEDISTKRARQKHKADKSKGRYDGVRQWNVGFRFGADFHKSVPKQDTSAEESVTSVFGTKQRPHIRRAHWAHYWYKEGDTKVRRLKWVSEYAVNVTDADTDLAVTSHKVDSDS